MILAPLGGSVTLCCSGGGWLQGAAGVQLVAPSRRACQPPLAPLEPVPRLKPPSAFFPVLHPLSYFGLGPQDISNRIDAAFNTSGYTIVSDNEHVYYVSPELRQKLDSQALPRVEDLAPPPSC